MGSPSSCALHDLSGNPEETLEEELEPKQQREIFEEAKENHFSSENVSVSMLETTTDELPAREPESPTEDVEEVVKNPSPSLEGGVSLETNNSNVVGMESKGVLCSDSTQESCNISEHQVDKEHKLDVSNSEPQKDPQSKEEAGKVETEMPTRSQSAAAGKKKKKKKRGKKKGGVHEDEKRHAATGDVTEPVIDGSTTKVHQQATDKAEDEQEQEETVEEELTKHPETFIPNEAIRESVVRDEEKETSEMDNVVVEAPTAPESVAHVPAQAVDKEDELNLETETVEAAETVEIFEPPGESSADAKKDEQDDEQGLETETVEAVEAVKPNEPSSDIKPSTESRADAREDQRDDEGTPKTEEGSETCPVPEESFCGPDSVHNTDGVDKVCRTAVAECLGETSPGSIQTESGSVGGAGEDGQKCDSEPCVPRDHTISSSRATNQSDRKDDTSACQPSGDGSESLSTSGPVSQPSAGADSRDKVSDEVQLSGESNCASPEEAEVDVVVESEKSVEASEQAEEVGDADHQCRDQTGEVFSDATDMLNNPDPPQAEALHQCPVDGHGTESITLEDSEHRIGEDNQLREPLLHSQKETLDDPVKDKWDYDSAQPNLYESEDDDEGGQSFDFEDIDVEAAVTADLQSPKMEAFEEGVEVLSDECDPGWSGPRQNNTDSNKYPSSDPAGDDAGQRADPQETAAVSVEEDASKNVHEKQKNPPEEDARVEEGAGLVVGQAVSLPVEEGLDAVKQLQGGDLVLEKSPDLVAGNPEPHQATKEVKKNSKKGKAKGKEDCKMA